jgi:hypothetical protein
VHSCRTLAASTLILLLPAAAFAQRGVNVRGERAGDVGGRGFAVPRSSDVDDHSPVGVVLDKRKKLALADSQVTALRAVAKQLNQRNADFYRSWDSVRVVLRAASGGAFGGGGGRGAAGLGGASEMDREAMGTARTRLTGLMRAIAEHHEWSRQETLKLLTPEQAARAQEFWAEDAEEFGRTLPGGGMPGAGPPGGGRPGGRRPRA